ncbi:uncharacterized protein LOC130726898 [Lotus japonicus]|uniref:uncharacterized protein LOC130726898 n=1 Tax=Lotus japonicus TaxID=34305 RepID=UPI0025856692|nr:uncharacterized protein LOC130726898 [Lotus japonicus]
MMSGRSTTFVSCFAFVTIILLVSIPFSQSQPSALIDQICKKTPYYDLCSSTLKSSTLSPNADLKEAAQVMVNDILAKASDTLNFIQGLVQSTKDPILQRKLGVCAEEYVPIVKYTLPQAAAAIMNKKDFKFASYSVSKALKDLSTSCDKNFGSAQSQLGDRNSNVEKLLQVGQAIIQQGIQMVLIL